LSADSKSGKFLSRAGEELMFAL